MAASKAVEVQAQEEVAEMTLVAIFGDREFYADRKDGDSGKECRKEIMHTLKAYREQRQELKQTSGHPFRIDRAGNQIQATNMLIAAVNAVTRPTDLYNDLRQPVGGKPGKRVMLATPWDLEDFITRYADAHFAQTKDVSFPNGKPAGTTLKTQRTDDDDDMPEMFDDETEDAEEVAGGDDTQQPLDKFGEE